MLREPGLQRHDNEPTENQSELFKGLIEQRLEGVEFPLVWHIIYGDDNNGLLMHIRRESQCLYSDRAVQKNNAGDRIPLTAEDLFSQSSDETTIELEFLEIEELTTGSLVNIKVRDDGYFGAFPATRHTSADDDGYSSIRLYNEASGNDPLPPQWVGNAIREFSGLLSRVDLLNPTEEEQKTIYETADKIGIVLSEQFVDPDEAKATEEEGIAIGNNLIQLTTAKGENYSQVERSYLTENYYINIEKDAFYNDCLGRNVTALVGVNERLAGGSAGEPSLLYLMSDGRLMFSDTHLYDGPEGNYTSMNPALHDYDQVKNAVVRAATADDLMYFLTALQEPEQISTNLE